MSVSPACDAGVMGTMTGTWLAVKQALTAMDLVMKQWAADLELDECGVMVLLLLGQRERCPACELALRSGRARQQVQRTLKNLQGRGVVAPVEVSSRGRVQAWSLTAAGRALLDCVERGARVWEEVLGSVVDLASMTADLERTAEVIVNRPGADGWRKGLLVPMELRAESMRSQALMEGLVQEAGAPVVTRVPRESERADEWAEVERAWFALWR